jgi:uncharacterized membrane protein YdfJ with MMPL/SSD domain
MSNLLPIRQAERRAILRNTAILGISLGIIQGIIWLISSPFIPGVSSLPSLFAFLFLIAPLIWVIAFFLHGIFVGKRTGDSNQAAVTGAFGGIFGGLVASVCQIFVLTLNLNGNGSSQLQSVGWNAVGTIIEIMFLTFAAGIAFGLLGGFIGKYISPQAVQPGKPSTPQPPMFYYPPVPASTKQQPQTQQPTNAPKPQE